MDELYKAARMLHPPRSRRAFWNRLGLSKHTFDKYVASVGMPWRPGYGTPPEEHLVCLVGAAPEHALQWASPSMCNMLQRSREQLFDQRGRDAVRFGRREPATYLHFVEIAEQLKTGARTRGAFDSYILLPNLHRLPVHVTLTYGRGKDVLFVEGVPGVPEAEPDPELVAAEVFNVRPGRIPREYALGSVAWQMPIRVEVLDEVMTRLQRERHVAD